MNHQLYLLGLVITDMIDNRIKIQAQNYSNEMSRRAYLSYKRKMALQEGK